MKTKKGINNCENEIKALLPGCFCIDLRLNHLQATETQNKQNPQNIRVKLVKFSHLTHQVKILNRKKETSVS